MNLLRKSILGIATLGLCLGFAASTANAQLARFKMPVEARWNGSVLEPGDYTVRFPTAADTLRIIRVSGNGTNLDLLIPATAQLNLDVNRPGNLTLVNVNGTYVVKSLEDTYFDRKFEFRVPKSTDVELSKSAHSGPAKIAVAVRSTNR